MSYDFMVIREKSLARITETETVHVLYVDGTPVVGSNVYVDWRDYKPDCEFEWVETPLRRVMESVEALVPYDEKAADLLLFIETKRMLWRVDDFELPAPEEAYRLATEKNVSYLDWQSKHVVRHATEE